METAYKLEENIFKVAIIDENSNSITESLGITEERRDELHEIAMNALKDTNKLSDAYKLSLAKVNHINEAIIVIIDSFNAVNTAREVSDKGSELLRMLEKIKEMSGTHSSMGAMHLSLDKVKRLTKVLEKAGISFDTDSEGMLRLTSLSIKSGSECRRLIKALKEDDFYEELPEDLRAALERGALED